ncbi:hypothetical protein HYDPIDRAFT_35866 [Hydnomerulius pinastri MD-312]|nr:hypothetical protein HYDPIDRAFT_35866 [Hydnomerulius pinastri MD-312]
MLCKVKVLRRAEREGVKRCRGNPEQHPSFSDTTGNLIKYFCTQRPPLASKKQWWLGSAFYNSIVRRNSVYVSTIFAGAFAFGVGFDVAIQSFWDKWNQGRQWKDIRDKYAPADDS